ncbi:MAG: hypothetical protein ABIH39_05975, partial [Candidatus Margulisiibacteriota bacterium]
MFTLPPKKDLPRVLRLFLSILLPLVIAPACVISFLYMKEVNTYKSLIYAHEAHSIEMLASRIIGDISLAANDMLQLAYAHNKYLLSCLKKENNGTRKHIDDEFVALLKQKDIYDQVSLINENGMEVIRANNSLKGSEIVPDNKMQNKKDRYYFRETMQLATNKHLYVSPLDLNVEMGAIEKPQKPTIRFGIPVFDHNGKKKGIVVVNYLGSKIIGYITQAAKKDMDETMLINQDGYWLKGLNPEDEWGFMFDERKPLTFARSFQGAWQKISAEESGQFKNRRGLFTFKTIYPCLIANNKNITEAHDDSLNYWKIILRVPPEKLNSTITGIRNIFLSLYITMFILFTVGSLYLAIISLQRKQAEDALLKANAELELRVKERTSDLQDANTKMAHTADVQRIINSILQILLEDIPIQKQLEHTLDIILAVNWINIEKRLCVYLADTEQKKLTLAAYRGVSTEDVSLASEIPLSSAFLKREQIARKVIVLKESTDDIIKTCGKYAIPIMLHDMLLGVLHLQFMDEQDRDKDDEAVFISIADTLAGVIHHYRTTQELKQA